MQIGIDLGASHIAVGLVDEKGNLIQKKEEDINKEKLETAGKQIEEKIVSCIHQLLDIQKIQKKDIKFIGIACPGEVSNGRIVSAWNLKLFNYPIVAILKQYFDIPIYLKNDAKCAAIAEKKFGCLQKSENSVFLTIGTGIGSAVFWNGELLKPRKLEGFELGHMIIQKQGRQCNCGKQGCFETYCSMTALKKSVIQEYEIQKKINGIQLHELIEKNRKEQKMQKILNEYLDYLMIGISNIITIFNPDTIGFGGSFSYYEEWFQKKMEEELKKNNKYQDAIPKIVFAQLRNDAGIIGAAHILE